MTPKQNVYKIVVYEIDAEGVSTTEIPAAQFTTEAMTPWDSVLAWSAQLEEEESS
jgi:hypothetical protein